VKTAILLAAVWMASAGAETDAAKATYVLGPDDQLTILGVDADEFANKPVRVDPAGDLNLPMIGRVHVAGMSVEDCENALNQRFAAYVKNPQLTVALTEVKSQPVSVMGAVNQPGVLQIQGRKTLLETLSAAGGLRQDAGYSVRITRQSAYGPLPLAGAKVDPASRSSVAEVDLKGLMEAKNPAENIRIMPHDTVTVPKAEIVYVVGEVQKPGGFPLGEKRMISVLQAVALAEGLAREAAPKNAKILRVVANSEQRQETPIDLKKVLSGQSEDLSLRADDILFIPGSASRKFAIRALETIVQTGTGVVIWRR
jgi:polysaccharide export outer membrane protein